MENNEASGTLHKASGVVSGVGTIFKTPLIKQTHFTIFIYTVKYKKLLFLLKINIIKYLIY